MNPQNEETDAHNAFVSRLALRIRLGLTHRGWLAFPERLSRESLNRVVEELWRDPGSLTGLIDPQSAARIAHLQQEFRVVFSAEGRTSQTLDTWLLARLLPCIAAAEAYFRTYSDEARPILSSIEPRTVSRRVMRLIRTMYTDANRTQIAPNGPRIIVPNPALQSPLASQNDTDSENGSETADEEAEQLSQGLQGMPTPSQGSPHGAASAFSQSSPGAAAAPSRGHRNTDRDPLTVFDWTMNRNISVDLQHSSEEDTPSRHSPQSPPGQPGRQLPPATPRDPPPEEQQTDHHSRHSSNGSASSGSHTPHRPSPGALAVPEPQAFVPLGIHVPWPMLEAAAEEASADPPADPPARRRLQTAICRRGRRPSRDPPARPQ